MRRTVLVELAMLAVMMPQSAYAAVSTYTVCSSGCDFTKLKGALTSTNLKDADVIVLKNGQTFTEDAAVITKNNLIIRAETPGTGTRPILTSLTSTTISVPDGKSVTFDYIEFGNGSAASTDRSEIQALVKASVTVTNSVFGAHDANAAPAGISMGGGNLTITDSTFRVMNNSAAQTGGAAIRAAGGAVTLTRVTATAGGSTLGYGAFLFQAGGKADINNSTVSQWIAASGGAVFVYNGAAVKTTDSTFSSNAAMAYGGGAVRVGAGTFAATRTAFTSNTAFSGPGGAIAGGATAWSTSGTVTLVGGSMVGNATELSGGGAVFVTYSSDLRADGTLFDNNSARLGGAVYATDSLIDVKNATFTTNRCDYTAPDDNTYGGGGAMFIDAENVALPAVTVTVADSAFSANSATTDAGAVFLTGQLAPVFSRVRFTANTAVRHGGAIYVLPSDSGSRHAGVFALDSDTFSANAAGSTAGSVGYYGVLSAFDTVAVNDTTWETANAGEGGALWIDYTALNLQRGMVCDNEASFTAGGGFYVGNNMGASLIANVFFVENKAGTRGGGLYVSDGDVLVQNNDFIRNQAVTGGGARWDVPDIAFRDNLVGLTAAGDGLNRASGTPSSPISITNNGFWTNTIAHHSVDGASQGMATANFVFTAPPAFVKYPGTDLIGNNVGCGAYDFRILATAVLPSYVDAGETLAGKDKDGSTADLGAYGGKYGLTAWYTDGDKDGTLWVYDCDDTNKAVHPGAAEACNGLDDNCNGVVDDGALSGSWYQDVDGDGFGDSTKGNAGCVPPVGYVGTPGDCKDNDKYVFPGAIEACNGKDDDCDALVDEAGAVGEIRYYADTDVDTYGDPAVSKLACSVPTGYIADGTDCDDKKSSVHPGAPEVCNGVSDDCDVQIDEGATDAKTYYADADGDGQGALASTTIACSAPSGYVLDSRDCNDADKAIYKGATELCNGVDDDCDGAKDNGLSFVNYYRDLDGDHYGSGTPINACSAPNGYVAAGGDCDDANTGVNPGAVEICNGKDENCKSGPDDGLPTKSYYPDADRDGQGDKSASAVIGCEAPNGTVADNRDCDDKSNTVYVGAIETCNLVDDDCNGTVDDNVSSYAFYQDADGDGYGGTTSVTDCKAPVGYVIAAGDCLDTNSSVNPGGAEKCGNSLDDDCSGKQDDNAIDAPVWYADSDKDGFGNPGATTTACGTTPPPGYVANSADCDDTRALVHDGVNYYADKDQDAYGDPTVAVYVCQRPTGFITDNHDCNDTNKDIHPGRGEWCATVGIDDDCDAAVDDADNDLKDGTTYHSDADNDGYGAASGGTTTKACTQPALSSKVATDCNDKSALIRPGAPEQCDSLDNDCDGIVDEDVNFVPWWPDKDGDGFGDTATAKSPTIDCKAPNGYIDNYLDCNDTKTTGAAFNPYAPEICNVIDDDCDGQIDENATNPASWFQDLDADGYGTQADVVVDCGPVPEHAVIDGDCNDDAATANPDANEICDRIDNDCDGKIDEGLTTYTVFIDADGDGYGDSSRPIEQCSKSGPGVAANGGDCDDGDASINPGADEVWYDGIDGDCAGGSDYDQDSDGYDALVEGGTDCADIDPSRHPGATDTVGDGVDSDCGGTDGPDGGPGRHRHRVATAARHRQRRRHRRTPRRAGVHLRERRRRRGVVGRRARCDRARAAAISARARRGSR